jgi:mono/diheme cytochrome c family protein
MKTNTTEKFLVLAISLILVIGISIGAAFGVTNVKSEPAPVKPSTAPALTAAATTAPISGPSPTAKSALNGQQLYAANCASCHSTNPPRTSKTQAQLITFIAGHQTGRRLNQEQIAAIAAYFKP